jgi:hypothetical protein
MNNREEIVKKITLDLWNNQVNRCTKLIDGLSDEQLIQEVAPKRNTGVYLVGHLTAVHDALLPLLDFGDKLHPELEEVFIKNPDKSSLPKPSVTQVRKYWHEVNALVSSKLESLTADQWFEKHTSVSEEDFKKEPHRNKLNVVSGRINHLVYHLGQMAFLNK